MIIVSMFLEEETGRFLSCFEEKKNVQYKKLCKKTE